MRVLVTGATGLIGSAVARRLKARGHEVTGLARSKETEDKLAADGFAAARGDLAEPQSVAEAARDADAIVHAASPNDQNTAAHDEASTRAILAAIAGTGKRFAYTSGCLLYGSTGNTPATEESRLDPADLVRWRAGLEQEVLAAARDGAHPIVVRPGWVYGNWGGAAMMMYGSAKEHGAAQYIGDGQNRWSTVHADDLADLYTLAIERAKPGVIYNGVQGAPTRLIEIARAASEAAGAAGRVVPWPIEEARQALWAFADAIACDQVVSGDKAKAELGWHPQRPSIIDELRSYARPA